MKTRLIIAVILVLTLITTACTSEKNDPEAVVLAYEEAWNAGDLDAALALFSDDLELYAYGGLALGKGYVKEMLQKWLDWESHTESFNIEVNGNQVEWQDRITWRGGRIQEFQFEATVEDGRFIYMRELCVEQEFGGCVSP